MRLLKAYSLNILFSRMILNFLSTLKSVQRTTAISTMSSNGDPIILSSSSPGLANYPQARLSPYNNSRTLFLSGLTSRRPDGTIAGVKVNDDGSLSLDAGEQTSAILQSIEAIIKQATNNKGGLGNVIDATIFLTDLKRDYAGMNEVWNKTWTDAQMAPTRTCVGVAELPSPKFAVEFKVTALVSNE